MERQIAEDLISETKEQYDVVVIGAGVAGLYLSWLLGRYGLRVCLVDSKRDLLNLSFHTLGSFADIAKLDLTRDVVASDIRACVFYSRGVTFTKRVNGYILDKKALHSELIEKCTAAGVEIKTSTKIAHEFWKAGSVEYVQDAVGNKYFGKIFVDATGINGFFSKKYGLQDKRPKIAVGLEYNVKYLGNRDECHLFIGKIFTGGYGWVFPLQNERAIVGYGSFNKGSVASLKKILDHAVQDEPLKSLIEVDNVRSYGGTIPVTGVKKNFIQKNIVCIGDSVSQVNPLVGEGYRFIMESAIILAPFIKQSIDGNDPLALKGYEAEWGKRFARPYSKAKHVQQLMNFFTKNDLITDILTEYVSRFSDKKFQKVLSGDF